MKQMLKSKDGKITTSTLKDTILVLIFVIVLFLLTAELVPEAQTAGDTLNASGVPLGTLFASTGVIFVVIMAAIFLVVVIAVLALTGSGK